MLFFMWDSDSNVAMATACNLWWHTFFV
jgi:hypothetical protein